MSVSPRVARMSKILAGPLRPGEYAGTRGVRNRDEAERALAIWRARLVDIDAQRLTSRAARRSEAGRDVEGARRVALVLIAELEDGIATGRWSA